MQTTPDSALTSVIPAVSSTSSAATPIFASPVAPATGVIAAHPAGFGFIRDENGDSHFVPPPLMKQFIPGDIVVFTTGLNAKSKKDAVESIALQERPESFWLGEIKPNFHKKLEFAADDAVHVKFRLPDNHGIKPGDVAQVRVAPGCPVATSVPVTVVANLGARNDKEFDIAYAIAKWRLPTEWPAAVLAEAEALATIVPTLESDMEDMRAWPFVTIDGESTRDRDDAIYAVERNGTIYLHVAIADVARYVKTGSALDIEARLRGTSVYFPDRVIPMLPKVLSNGLCSLNPGQPRAALVSAFVLGPDGQIREHSTTRALIQSRAALSYNEVTAFVEGKIDFPPEVAATVTAIKKLYDQQAPARELRGLLEYRSREPKLDIAPDGQFNVGWESPTIAHGMVEECMLAANRAAALFIPMGSVNHLFRYHQGVDLEKWAITCEWLVSIGIAPPEAPTLPQLQAILKAQANNPAYPLIEWRIRRSFAPAVYDNQLTSHFTLGFPAYAHSTSPIRRYPDLLGQRAWLMEGGEEDFDVAVDCSERSRRAQMASRFPWDRIKRRALWREQQKTFGARLATSSKRGCKAVIDEWETAAFVPGASLEKLGYAWEPTTELWTRKVDSVRLEVGQAVTVKLMALEVDGAECELVGSLCE